MMKKMIDVVTIPVVVLILISSIKTPAYAATSESTELFIFQTSDYQRDEFIQYLEVEKWLKAIQQVHPDSYIWYIDTGDFIHGGGLKPADWNGYLRSYESLNYIHDNNYADFVGGVSGNHEINNIPAGLQTKYSYLASDYHSDNEYLYSHYYEISLIRKAKRNVIVDVGPVKIGLLGFSDNYRKNRIELVDKKSENIEPMASNLRSQGADFVILLYGTGDRDGILQFTDPYPGVDLEIVGNTLGRVHLHRVVFDGNKNLVESAYWSDLTAFAQYHDIFESLPDNPAGYQYIRNFETKQVQQGHDFEIARHCSTCQCGINCSNIDFAPIFNSFFSTSSYENSSFELIPHNVPGQAILYSDLYLRNSGQMIEPIMHTFSGANEATRLTLIDVAYAYFTEAKNRYGDISNNFYPEAVDGIKQNFHELEVGTAGENLDGKRLLLDSLQLFLGADVALIPNEMITPASNILQGIVTTLDLNKIGSAVNSLVAIGHLTGSELNNILATQDLAISGATLTESNWYVNGELIAPETLYRIATIGQSPASSEKGKGLGVNYLNLQNIEVTLIPTRTVLEAYFRKVPQVQFPLDIDFFKTMPRDYRNVPDGREPPTLIPPSTPTGFTILG